MNTSDQSLFPIDSAFKRRWDWTYVPINTEQEKWAINVNGTNYAWGSFLEKINEQIEETTSSEDKKLGFYFCKAKDGVISADRFVSKVLFFIYNDVFKDYGFDKDFFKDKDSQKTLSFYSFYHMDGSVNEERVQKLLENLAVEKSESRNSVENSDSLQSGEDSAGEKQGVLKLKSVAFPDGESFSSDEMTKDVLYTSVLKKIGMDRVATVDLPWKRRECPIISKEKYPEVEQDPNQHYSFVDGYYVIDNLTDDTKINVLNKLNDDLRLNLTINTYR